MEYMDIYILYKTKKPCSWTFQPQYINRFPKSWIRLHLPPEDDRHFSDVEAWTGPKKYAPYVIDMLKEIYDILLGHDYISKYRIEFSSSKFDVMDTTLFQNPIITMFDNR